MERLTERVENCPDPKEIYGVWVKDHDYVAAANRLADYEDTGLTPGRGAQYARRVANYDVRTQQHWRL